MSRSVDELADLMARASYERSPSPYNSPWSRVDAGSKSAFIKDMQAALAALTKEGFAVVPEPAALTWTSPASPNEDCSYDHVTADLPFGKFRIEWKSWKDYPSFSVEFDLKDGWVGTASTLEEAKHLASVYRAMLAAGRMG